MLEFEMWLEFSILFMTEFLLENSLILSNNQVIYVYALCKRIDNIYNFIQCIFYLFVFH